VLDPFRLRDCRRWRDSRCFGGCRFRLLHRIRSGLLRGRGLRLLRAVSVWFIRVASDRDGDDLVLLHDSKSVAGLHLKGIVLEADDGAGDLRTVLQFDFVRARGCSKLQQNERSEAGDCSGGYDPSTHAFEYRAGTRERQGRARDGCWFSQQEQEGIDVRMVAKGAR